MEAPALRLAELLRELEGYPRETDWLEYKRGNDNPEEIGKNLSALANAAALHGREQGYLVWGVDDETRALVGTGFHPSDATKGGEPLVAWLSRLLSPRIEFEFQDASVSDVHMVLCTVSAAWDRPVAFQGTEYVRVGACRHRLSDHPEKERALWRGFDRRPFEDRYATASVGATEVLELLDASVYFSSLGLPVPEAPAGVLGALHGDRMVWRADDGGWRVTHLGALLLARHLSDFAGLGRKAPRLVQYAGTDRIHAVREIEVTCGYVRGYAELNAHLEAMLPHSEVIEAAIRQRVPQYPPASVRELTANALIHQDFAVPGCGPIVEIFTNRIEVTNPGAPLVETRRWLDSPPRSRNERLASFLRRAGVCEERGSGVDRVVFLCEFHQLPAPLFALAGTDGTRVTLLAPMDLGRMTRDDRVRACYLHACLRYVQHEYLTNSSLRARFGISTGNSATASRYIREAVEAGDIRPDDPGAAPKLMRYVPFWA